VRARAEEEVAAAAAARADFGLKERTLIESLNIARSRNQELRDNEGKLMNEMLSLRREREALLDRAALAEERAEGGVKLVDELRRERDALFLEAQREGALAKSLAAARNDLAARVAALEEEVGGGGRIFLNYFQRTSF
jgi:hypothetical protein